MDPFELRARLLSLGAAPSAVLILEALDREDGVSLSVQEIAARTFLPDRRTRDALGVLTAAGFVSMERLQEAWGFPARRKYRLSRPLYELAPEILAWQGARHETLRLKCRTRWREQATRTSAERNAPEVQPSVAETRESGSPSHCMSPFLRTTRDAIEPITRAGSVHHHRNERTTGKPTE